MNETILEMKNITKYLFDMYGKKLRGTDVTILKDVDFDLRKGEVHVLVGENGAGKSTLMNILGGLLPQDEGEIILEGNKVTISNALEARKMGIAFIHQELNLCLNLDIAHNIFLGREPKNKYGLVDTKQMYKKSSELLSKLGFEDLSPKNTIRSLSTAHQQIVEIVKCLSYESKILIMDEPTTSLSQSEIDHLFELIKKLKNEGLSIIYISHRFDELVEIGDRISVLRDGQMKGTQEIKCFDYNEIVQLMIGRTFNKMIERHHIPSDEVILEVKGLQISSRCEPIDLTVNKGEILGVGGLLGSGRTELAQTIFGARKKYAGKVIYKGMDITTKESPDFSLRNGVAYLSEDRKLEGIIVSMNIRENITLAALKNIFKGKVFTNIKEEKVIAEDNIKSLNIISRGTEQVVSTLSGGNQQKVLFSKWLSTKPELLILDEPTRGIDVNAKAEIYKLIDNIAKQGIAIIMISSELPELIGLSDRMCIMKKGTVIAEIKTREEMNQENVLKYITGGEAQNTYC